MTHAAAAWHPGEAGPQDGAGPAGFAVLGGLLPSPLLRGLERQLGAFRLRVRHAASRSDFLRQARAPGLMLVVLGGGAAPAAEDGLDWAEPPGTEGGGGGGTEGGRVPRIFVDATASQARAVRALRLGFADYLEWPGEKDALPEALRRHLGRMSQSVATAPAPALRLSTAEACPILFSGRAMAELIAHARRVAATDCGVLITGETGTGKEVFAEFLHRESARAAGPLVKLNCAALPEHLVESELFGHERGAFTGATVSFPGHIALADRGTLLLDEIGDLALQAQGKVLRALEDHVVTPLGGRRPRRVDLRVLAATHQPLEALVAERRFRADLFWRLNVARIEIPPLRERAEDVPLLFRHFLRLAATTWRRPLPEVAPELLAALLDHPWPGNLRELRNVAESALVAGNGGPRLLPAHLPPALRPVRGAARICDERLRILAALARTRWNKTDAARELEWSRMTLYRKMGKHGLMDRDA